MVLLSIAGLMAMEAQKFIDYFNYPVTTTIKIEQEDDAVDFPAVTMCNLNKFKKSEFDNDETNRRLYQSLYAAGTETQNINWTDPFYAQFTEPIPHNEAIQEMKRLAHKPEDMFSMCMFNDVNLNCSDVLTELITDEGFCYSFNHGNYIMHSSQFKATRPGNAYGFKIFINIQQNEYFYGPHNSAGFKVSIYTCTTFYVFKYKQLPIHIIEN